MPDSISAELKRLVRHRAAHRCEYCLIAEEDTFAGCEVDHILSRKHGGGDQLSNLAYACLICNRRKGSDLGSLDSEGRLIRFFNPRIDTWNQNLKRTGFQIEPISEIGTVTARIFGFNDPERILEREASA